jgi:hypothetical protein
MLNWHARKRSGADKRKKLPQLQLENKIQRTGRRRELHPRRIGALAQVQAAQPQLNANP